jgi:hypothetical protein
MWFKTQSQFYLRVEQPLQNSAGLLNDEVQVQWSGIDRLSLTERQQLPGKSSCSFRRVKNCVEASLSSSCVDFVP